MRNFLNEVRTSQLQAMLKEQQMYKGVSLCPSEVGSWVLEFARGHLEAVKVILAASGRKDIKGHDGKTPIDLAKA